MNTGAKTDGKAWWSLIDASKLNQDRRRRLVEKVAESGNQWLRVAFRHYPWYLYIRGEISH